MNITERRRAGSRHPSCALLVAGLLCAGFVPGALATGVQHEPVTGEMLDGSAASAPAVSPAADPHDEPIEDVAATDASLPDVDLGAPADGIESAGFDAAEAGQAVPEPAPMPAYADAPAPYVPPSSNSNEIGSATRHLLQLQADNAIAGPPRPLLGAEASAAYQRYLDSFNPPIPEFFETNVETDSGSGK
jgi:hypothetical protein